MTYPRKSLVSIKETPYYHCVARCVRRAWLWGVDEYAGKDYSHRKHWVVDRLQELSAVFAIEVCAFAVMSNHYHTVVFVDTERARQWSERAVIKRWKSLFRIPYLVERYGRGQKACRAVALALDGRELVHALLKREPRPTSEYRRRCDRSLLGGNTASAIA